MFPMTVVISTFVRSILRNQFPLAIRTSLEISGLQIEWMASVDIPVDWVASISVVDGGSQIVI